MRTGRPPGREVRCSSDFVTILLVGVAERLEVLFLESESRLLGGRGGCEMVLWERLLDGGGVET